MKNYSTRPSLDQECRRILFTRPLLKGQWGRNALPGRLWTKNEEELVYRASSRGKMKKNWLIPEGPKTSQEAQEAQASLHNSNLHPSCIFKMFENTYGTFPRKRLLYVGFATNRIATWASPRTELLPRLPHEQTCSSIRLEPGKAILHSSFREAWWTNSSSFSL